jgi:hypothetical protein
LNLTDNDIDDLIIVDVDDTCLDTISGFVKWLAKYNRLEHVTGTQIKSRENLGPWLGVDDSLADNWMRDFCERTWEWGTLMPSKDSLNGIKRLQALDFNFIAFSRTSSDINRGTLKRANIEIIYPGVFEELYMLGLHANPYPLLIDFKSAICITANETVAKASAQAGHITYLLDQPWNREFNDMSVRRFNNWEEIYIALLNLRQKLT